MFAGVRGLNGCSFDPPPASSSSRPAWGAAIGWTRSASGPRQSHWARQWRGGLGRTTQLGRPETAAGPGWVRRGRATPRRAHSAAWSRCLQGTSVRSADQTAALRHRREGASPPPTGRPASENTRRRRERAKGSAARRGPPRGACPPPRGAARPPAPLAARPPSRRAVHEPVHCGSFAGDVTRRAQIGRPAKRTNAARHAPAEPSLRSRLSRAS
jgi:hypothetical protein